MDPHTVVSAWSGSYTLLRRQAPTPCSVDRLQYLHKEVATSMSLLLYRNEDWLICYGTGLRFGFSIPLYRVGFSTVVQG